MGFIADHSAGNAKLQWRLVEISFDTPLRITDCDIDVEYEGHTWLRVGLSVSNIANSIQGPTCQVTIPDADQSLFALLDATSGGEDLPVRILLVEFQPQTEVIGGVTYPILTTAVPDDAVLLFTGRILTATKDTTGGTDQVQLSCGPFASTANVDFPTRTFASLVRTT
jgi:hypothetical protein